MIERRLTPLLAQRLRETAAVVLLGPRQVGKTTLALEIAREQEAVYLDLESEADRARLSDPELYLAGHLDRLVILDEIHRAPRLFPTLRGLVDRARRSSGRREGLYLLLGSASMEMLKQSGETLAGRVSYLELSPFDVMELTESADDRADDRLWAIEIKRSLSPRPERGFHSGCADLDPERRFVVYPGSQPYPLTPEIEVIPLRDLARRLVEGGT